MLFTVSVWATEMTWYSRFEGVLKDVDRRFLYAKTVSRAVIFWI